MGQVTTTNPANGPTQLQRDTRGNITSLTDPLTHTTGFGYDANNNLVSVTDPTGIVTSFTHDLLGNVLTRTSVIGGRSVTSSFVYDDTGNLLNAIDPLGAITTYTYDSNGNISSAQEPAQLHATQFTYNYRGQPTKRTDALAHETVFSYVSTGCTTCSGGGEKLVSLKDPANAITSFEYDKRGLPAKITDPLTRQTDFAYNSMGRLTTRTDRNGTALTYAYTTAGNLGSITYPDLSQTTYTYNNLNLLTGMTDALGNTVYTRDALGRITGSTDPHGFSLSFTYDTAGNLTGITYPDSTQVTYAYDNANRLTVVTNWLNQTATYAYDEVGRLSNFTGFNGIVTHYDYNDANQLTGMGSGTIANYQFTLDESGKRTSSTQTEPAAPSFSLGSIGYTYNNAKNRLEIAGVSNYTYDDEGQLETAGSTAYTFNYNRRLSGIGAATQFFYDGVGNRLRAVRDGVQTRYIYDPWGNLLAEADSTNQITRKYIYGKGLIAMQTPSARYCYHFNPTGHTVAITDMTGTVVNSYAYDPFGNILAEQETVAQPFKYVGQYGVMAEPNGLYYMRARYYDPAVGRFISEDPIGFAGGDANLFAYTRNNPINRIDPLGLFVEASYDSTNGLLSVTDLDSGRSITIAAESGGKPFGDPISLGSYDILERQGRPDFYRLDKRDATPYDDIDDFTGRSHFRLHRPGRTTGCVAAKDWDDWKKVDALITNTQQTEMVPDNFKPWWKFWPSTPGQLIRYGTLTVR